MVFFSLRGPPPTGTDLEPARCRCQGSLLDYTRVGPARALHMRLNLGCVMRGDGDGILDDLSAYWMPTFHKTGGIVRCRCGEREMSRGERGRWWMAVSVLRGARDVGIWGCHASAPRTRDCFISGVVIHR